MARHILAASDFNREDLVRIFNTSFGIENKIEKNIYHDLLRNRKGVGLLFFEESYRTHNSFSTAVTSMGGRILFDIQKEGVFSSYDGAVSKKGESLESVVENHCYDTVGAIVIRHPQNGSAMIAAKIAEKYGINIINAGDGSNEHPTQSLLDQYTIWKRRNHELDNLKLVVCNDLEKSRTIHSLTYALSANFKIPQIGVCAPEGANLPQSLVDQINAFGTSVARFNNLREAGDWAEFIYMTRPQKERFTDNPGAIEKFKNFQVDLQTMEYLESKGVFVLHPQPIDSINFNEITPEALKNGNCIIMEQSHNGLPVRMALLRMLLVEES